MRGGGREGGGVGRGGEGDWCFVVGGSVGGEGGGGGSGGVVGCGGGLGGEGGRVWGGWRGVEEGGVGW